MSASRRSIEARSVRRHAGAWLALLLGLAALTPEAALAGYSYITARGRAIYHDDDGLPVGIKHAKVRVWDTDWFFPCGVLGGCRELIGEGETDGDGYFAVSGSGSDDWCMTYVPGTFICAIGVSDDPDPYVEIEASSVHGAVQTAGLAPATYCFKSGYLDNVPANVGVQFGEISPDSPGAYPWQGPGGGCSAGEDVSGDDAAWQLFNNLRESWEFVRTYSLANPGSSGADTAGEIPPVRLFWPDLGSFYRPAIPLLDQGAISIQRGDEWNEATVMHEYGHHVLYHFAESPFPNYNNGNYDGTPLPFFDDGHGVWAWEHGSIHWTEGWPDYLSEVLTTQYGKDNSASGTWGSGGSFENPPAPEDTNYRLIEGFTAAILWDLSDPVNTAEDHDANGSKDRLAEDFGAQWNVLVNYDPAPGDSSHDHPVTIDEFWAGFAAFHPSLAGRLSEIYDENHITDKPKPDLRVVALGNPPASIVRGQSFTVSDTTGNSGNAGGGTASVTRFFLSADGLITTADVPIGERVVPELGGMGSNSNAVTTVTVPLWLPTGSYVLGACADADGHLFEGNETNNCNASGVVQVQIPTLQFDCFVDADGDGVLTYGPDWNRFTCAFLFTTDCNDQNPAIPGPDVCDGVDNDCDGFIDQGLLQAYWEDIDGDGYGSGFPTGLYCAAPPGQVANHSDCNDQDGRAYPGAPEVCDQADNDCDGLVDEGLTLFYYPDADGDGYGALASWPVRACSAPSGHVTRGGDCNDAAAAVHPAASEGPFGHATCADGVDNDCDGLADGGDPGCQPVTVTLGVYPPGPQPAGAQLLVAARIDVPPPGAGGYEYAFSLKGPRSGNLWITVRSYSSDPVWHWDTTGADVGATELAVWVKATGSTAPPEATATVTCTVEVPAPTDVAVEATPASPQPPGTSVTFSASVTPASPGFEYRYWHRGPATGDLWQVVRDYGPAPSWTFVAGLADSGANKVKVQVRRAGTTVVKEVETILDYTVSYGLTLTLAPPAPREWGAGVTASCGVELAGAWECRFLKKGPATGNLWQVVQNYGGGNSWLWNTAASDAGLNQLKAQARRVGSGVAKEREVQADYRLLPKLTVSSRPASPSRVGVPITFTGRADPTNRTWEYRFMLRGPSTSGQWVLTRNYTTSPDWTWTPPAGQAGVYKVKVRVREAGSGVIYETETITSHTVNP